MPKNSKNQDSNGATDANAAESVAPTKKTSKAAAKTTAPKTAAKKPSAKVTAKKTSARKAPARKSKGHEPSDDEIRLRAYFIAERRAQMLLEGDPSNDWLEARKQLLEEADQREAAARTPAPV